MLHSLLMPLNVDTGFTECLLQEFISSNAISVLSVIVYNTSSGTPVPPLVAAVAASSTHYIQ